MAGSSKLETRDDAAIHGPIDAALSAASDDGEEPEPTFLDTRRIIQTAVIVLLLVAAIYILLPKVVGLEDAIAKLDDGDPLWIAVAFAFSILISASYIALFRGVVGENVIHLEWREAYEISMASFAASRLFSGGGAGGIVLTYWALRKAGMERRQSACRMVAFLVLLYSIYLLALVVFGILLRTGVLPGANPPGLTIVPAAIGGSVLALLVLIALIPEDVERRFTGWSAGYRFGRIATPSRAAPAPRSPSSAAPGVAAWRCSGASASGPPTSARCGRASRRSTSTSPSGSSSRATSSGWSPT
jgi:uncharacterized membrane protein YbhN (UPF0104 family)